MITSEYDIVFDFYCLLIHVSFVVADDDVQIFTIHLLQPSELYLRSWKTKKIISSKKKG
jgi:hypothetical protein